MPRFDPWRKLVLPATHGGVAISTPALQRAAQHRPVVTFLRHLGEMTLAMFVGMFGFGLGLGVAADVAGSSFETVRVSRPELFMLGMGSAISVTMVAWMRHRRHSWRQGLEMTASMFVTVLAVLGCYSAGAITADQVCPLSCVLMIPAMAVAMLFRPDVYTTPHPHPA
jgi:hypothetical protein